MNARQRQGSGRLVILSGPSCAGKSPLKKALQRLYPHWHERLQPVTLYNDRAPRPGERDGVDYHFRSRPEIQALQVRERYIVMDVRQDLLALDLETLSGQLARGEAFFEGSTYIGRVLQTDPRLADTPRLSVFMSPLTREEIESLHDPAAPGSLRAVVTDLMRRKLLRRTQGHKGTLSLKDLEDIERRAGTAYEELGVAHLFDHVLPNHDGEDSEHWAAFPQPIGDARRALRSFLELLEGRTSGWAESWPNTLLP